MNTAVTRLAASVTRIQRLVQPHHRRGLRHHRQSHYLHDVLPGR